MANNQNLQNAGIDGMPTVVANLRVRPTTSEYNNATPSTQHGNIGLNAPCNATSLRNVAKVLSNHQNFAMYTTNTTCKSTKGEKKNGK